MFRSHILSALTCKLRWLIRVNVDVETHGGRTERLTFRIEELLTTYYLIWARTGHPIGAQIYGRFVNPIAQMDAGTLTAYSHIITWKSTSYLSNYFPSIETVNGRWCTRSATELM